MNTRQTRSAGPESGFIRSAGGIVTDPYSPGLRLILIHRPKYGDWCLPKGKVKQGEDEVETALREVLEETGMLCRIQSETATLYYLDRKKRTKYSRFWIMTPLRGSFKPTDEVDHCEWFDLHVAIGKVTRTGERDLLLELSSKVLRTRVEMGLWSYSISVPFKITETVILVG